MYDLNLFDDCELEKILAKKDFLKRSSGKYIIYDRNWLLNNLEAEFNVLKLVKESAAIKPFSLEDFKEWMEAKDRMEDDGK